MEQRLYNYARSLGYSDFFARLLVAQAKHETGNFTSNAFKQNNNLYGYKFVGQAIATKGIQSSEGDFYANYKRPEDSLFEVAMWIKRRQREGKFPGNLALITSASQYASLLKKSGYYGDTVKNYTSGLTRAIAALKKSLPGAAGSGAAVAALLFFFGW